MSARYLARPAGNIGGSVRVPGDKSVSHRSLMLGGIARGTTQVEGFLESADCLATLAALEAMGVAVERDADRLRLRGVGLRGLRAPTGTLDMGNAGTAMRLFMGLLAGQAFGSTLIGDESLMRRPMERVAAPLRLMGGHIETLAGRPPVRIRPSGGLRGIRYELPMASAQVKSALLLAGLYAGGTTQITEPAPTRDHTERMLESFGVEVRRAGRVASVEGGAELRGTRIQVPGDFSSAAFFIVAGCLAAHDGLTLQDVGVNPTRTGLIDILRLMGADIRVHEHAASDAEPVADIEVRAAPLHGIDVPEHLVPLAIDELPVAFIAAACARGRTRVTGAEELRVKESDRLAVMAEGLAALGIANELQRDGIVIEGGRLHGGRVDSHGDHRVAMSFAVASCAAVGQIEIDDVANVATSFPGFVSVARAAGIDVEELGTAETVA